MYINNSRMVAWQQCYRYYALRYILGLEPKIGSDALAFGSASHDWAGAYYQGILAGTPANRDDLHQTFETSYRHHGNPTYIDEFETNLAMGHRLIDDYLDRDYILDDFAPVQVESQFTCKIGDHCYKCGARYEPLDNAEVCVSCGSPVFHLVGRADLIVTRQNRLVVLDHKTAKGVGKLTMDGWSHCFGLIGYAYGVDRTTDFHVTQFGVNIIKKLKTVGKDTKVCPSCRNGKRKKLTCLECQASGYVPMDPVKAFYRDYFRVTAHDFKMLEHNRIRLSTDIVKEKEVYKATPDLSYPMNCKSCEKFSGCDFRDVCWQGDDEGEWWNIPATTLANFNVRDDDYVDDLVKEELE